MRQYIEIIKEVLYEGTWKPAARENMPRTLSRFGIMKRFDLSKGFPLLTARKMAFKWMAHELIWFLNGDTNIKYLHDNGVTRMWHDDAYRYYCKAAKNPQSFEQWFELMDHFPFAEAFGKLGPIYGHQWRNWNGSGYDQIANVIKQIKEQPYGRYKVVTAWNPTDIPYQALPACHMIFMFNCRDTSKGLTLDCSINQRSCDVALGVPINIASYALLTHIIAKLTNTIPGDLIWKGEDVHIYEDQMPGIYKLLERPTFKLPTLIMHDVESYEGLNADQFELFEYKHGEPINFNLSTGAKK